MRGGKNFAKKKKSKGDSLVLCMKNEKRKTEKGLSLFRPGWGWGVEFQSGKKKSGNILVLHLAHS